MSEDIATSISPESKEGTDWFANFNPKVKSVLSDVSLLHTFDHESVVCCVKFSADGNYLATGCNHTAQIYDTKTGLKTCTLVDDGIGKLGDLYIRSVCFSPDGKHLVTAAGKNIKIWDIATKNVLSVFEGHTEEIYTLDYSFDSQVIVSGAGDNSVRIWDIQDGTSKILTTDDGVTSVAISPNGQFVAAGSLDKEVRIWEMATGTLVERLRGHRKSVYSIVFTPDGKGLVSASLDESMKYWDISDLVVGKEGAGGGVSGDEEGKIDDASRDRRCKMEFLGHKDYVLCVAISSDGAWVTSGSKDRSFQFWDTRDATAQCRVQGHRNSVIALDFSPVGNLLVSGSGDWRARIWSYTVA